MITFAKLYGRTSKGDIKQWQVIACMETDGTAVLRKEYGKVGGKISKNARLVKTGKNIGKKNETTAYEQACLMGKSAHQKQLDKGMTTDPSGVSDVKLPMLAKTFNGKVDKPVATQKKYNGVRCIATKTSLTTVDLRSRGGKSYNETLMHLVEPLLKMLVVGETLDGEIYKHEMTFQQIVKRVKKYRPGKTEELEYHVYDICNEDMPFSSRARLLEKMYTPDTGVVKVEMDIANTADEVYHLHDEYVQQGFEGIIIRSMDGLYKFSHRSKDLQKHKHFVDAEFLIVGGHADADGGVIYECLDGKGNGFNCRPKGSMEHRRFMLTQIETLTGSQLTVRYQNLSDDGTPIFPVGLSVRDYE